MQRLEVSGAVRPIYGSLGVKRLSVGQEPFDTLYFTFLRYYQATVVPSGMKPNATWPVIFLRSQGDNQNSDVALNHALLNE